MDNEKPRSSSAVTRFIKLSCSVLAAALGVQSKKNLEDDFQQSSPFPFIVAGIVFTVLFVLTLILIVKWVLSGLAV